MNTLIGKVVFLMFALSVSVSFAATVTATGSGEDWFYSSTACERAKEEVEPLLSYECRFRNLGELESYEFNTTNCSCTENRTQPRFRCSISGEGICKKEEEDDDDDDDDERVADSKKIIDGVR